MQNTVYERKQNSEDFFSSLAVTCFRFGNRPANGLVTEQPQYSVVVCVFSTSQNTEISLIPNGLRLIFTCSLSLALLCIFHCTRHTYATLSLALGTDIITIKNVLGHKQESTTMRYTKVVNPLKEQAAKRLSINTISQNTEQYEKGNF